MKKQRTIMLTPAAIRLLEEKKQKVGVPYSVQIEKALIYCFEKKVI